MDRELQALATLDELQELLDHHKIRKTLMTYCHGCDRCDEPRMASIYTKDGWDNHGAISASGADFSRDMTATILATNHSMSHLLGQSQINVEGDTAGAETYFIAVCLDKGEDDAERCNQLGGRFVDKLERIDGEWFVKHRTVVRDWAITLPVEEDWTAHAGLFPGQRSDDDPSYEALGLKHGGHQGGCVYTF